MIQHHLVFNFTGFDDGVTYYEANLQAAYYLVRSGKILELVENRLGSYAVTVMSAIMYRGHAQVSHLEELEELQTQHPQPNGVHEGGEMDDENEAEEQEQTNGVNGDHAAHETLAMLHPTLKALAAHGYISRVREAHFQSAKDNFLEAERVVKAKPGIKQLKGKKLEEAIAHEMDALLKQRLEGDLSEGLVFGGVPRGAKRRFSFDDTGASSKKRRMSYNAVDEDGEDEESDGEMDDDDTPMQVSCIPILTPLQADSTQADLVIRVNYAKLDVALRNRRFIELAEQTSHPVTTHIYDCLLRRVEYQTPKCRETNEIPREGEEVADYSVAIQLQHLARDVDPHMDVAGSVGPSDASQPFLRRGKRPLEDGINGDAHEGANGLPSESNHTYNVDQHLCLLAQPPHCLTSKVLINALINWKVEFRHLARKLRHLELERMIEARYGDVALRVIRVLRAKGRLDEKRLQEISLLPFKDLRQVLASMQAAGFVDLQEVPRDAQRQPSRTIYLWFYDPDRVCSSVMEDTYKTMSRCLQRLRFGRSRLKDFLEKTERSDIKGHEEEFLSDSEQATLREWRAKEALLLGEVARLDDMIAVIRDY